MAPQPSKMKGQGRILDSGDLVKGKRFSNLPEKDGEYQQESEEDSDSEESHIASDSMSVVNDADEVGASVEGDENDNSSEYDSSEVSDVESMAEVDLDDNLDYIEVKELGGKYIKHKVSQVPKQATVESQVIEDDRFKKNSSRGAARLAVVIKRFADVRESQPEKTYDFSETANGNISSVRVEMIPCKKGTYLAVKSKINGDIRYKEMSQAQLAKAAAADDGEPCQCSQCELQAKNSINLPVGSSRLRKEPFVAKYGAGRTLGDGTRST